MIDGTAASDRHKVRDTGFGIPLINAPAQRHEIELVASGGRTVRMFFVPGPGTFSVS